MTPDQIVVGKRIVATHQANHHTSGTIVDSSDWLPSTFAVIWDDEPFVRYYLGQSQIQFYHEHP
jgi:hypothetical protein